MPDQDATKNASKGNTGTVNDPYRGYNFRVEIQGVADAAFTECSGMGASVHAIRYAEGRSRIVRRIPGPVEYADITLRYGLTSSADLWNWMLSGVNGKVERRNVSIVLYDSDGAREVMRWNLAQAWVSRWNAAPLDAMAREIAIESMTIVYETLERVAPAGGAVA
ncbi:MAG: phage tail protein [Thermoanaerobaculia bacterium]